MSFLSKIFQKDKEKNKIINIKMDNRSSGPGRATDELWNSWKLLDKGAFIETDDSITLTNQKGEKFTVKKNGELVAAKMYNRFLTVDLGHSEVYEGQNPTGGYFLLYRFRDINRRNEFVLSGIMGVAGGSSINFVVV